MDDVQRIAMEQFAEIEVTKFMMVDLWSTFLREEDSPTARAMDHRKRHLAHFRDLADESSPNPLLQKIYEKIDENWSQIFDRLSIK